MDPIIFIAQVLGIIGWLLLIYSYSREDIKELLLVQIGVCAFDLVSYLLLGADAGLLICLIELIKTILYYKTDWDSIIFKVSFVALIIAGFISVKDNPEFGLYSWLPIIGAIIDSYGSSKDSKIANIASIISNSLWTIYDIIILSYVGAFNDIVVVLANISILTLGYSRIMRINKFRIVKYTYINKKTVHAIQHLDEKKYGYEYMWSEDYQRKLFYKNKDSLLVVKYKHDVIGYINYISIKEDYYDLLKRKRKLPKEVDLDHVIPYKSNRKNYILFESINVKKEYERDQTIDMIVKKVKFDIRLKHSKRVYIESCLGYAMTDFEHEVFKRLGFVEIKKFEDGYSLYELDKKTINKIDKKQI